MCAQHFNFIYKPFLFAQFRLLIMKWINTWYTLERRVLQTEHFILKIIIIELCNKSISIWMSIIPKYFFTTRMNADYVRKIINKHFLHFYVIFIVINHSGEQVWVSVYATLSGHWLLTPYAMITWIMNVSTSTQRATYITRDPILQNVDESLTALILHSFECDSSSERRQ